TAAQPLNLGAIVAALQKSAGGGKRLCAPGHRVRPAVSALAARKREAAVAQTCVDVAGPPVPPRTSQRTSRPFANGPNSAAVGRPRFRAASGENRQAFFAS